MLDDESSPPLHTHHLPLMHLGTLVPDPGSPSDLQSKRKRDREPAWTAVEMMALARAKRQEWENQVHCARAEKGKSKVEKWTEIVKIVKENGVERAKWQKVEDKWDNMYQDFKKVCQWQSRPGVPHYWKEMSRQLRKEHNLPVNFDLDVYNEMYAFLGGRTASLPLTRELSPQGREASSSGLMKPIEDDMRGNSPVENGHEEVEREVDGHVILDESFGKQSNTFRNASAGGLLKSKSSLQDAIKETTEAMLHMEDKREAWFKQEMALEKEKIGVMREQGQAVINALEKIASALGKIAEKM